MWPTQPPTECVAGLKRSQPDADHAPPSSVEVKNKWNSTHTYASMNAFVGGTATSLAL